MEELTEYAKQVIKDYPELKAEVVETVENAQCEVEDGESESNEVGLAYQYIQQDLLNTCNCDK
jgi:hypothetical protein